MKFKRECETKTGEALLIRSLCAADAEEVLRLCRRGTGETLNMMRYPDEWTATAQQEAEILARAEASAKAVILGAFVGGKLAGMCSMQPVHPGDRARHRAGVGMMVLKSHWQQGIGGAMMQALIDAAGKTNIEQLELDVVADNKAAIALYKKYGFVEYGRHPRMMKYRDGRYADTLLMMLVLRGENLMDIWESLYERAKAQYRPEEVSPFLYAHHVVCAIEGRNGKIYTGFCIEGCSGVMNLCAERVAWLNMYVDSGETVIRRMIAFRDQPPYGGGSGMPCGACREFFMQAACENADMEIMVDYEKRETVTLGELMPAWWGHERYEKAKNN